VQIGVTLPQTRFDGDPVWVRDFAQAAEDLGFSHIVVYDHVLGAEHAGRDPELWGPYTENDPFHEPFVVLGYIAAITTRLGLSTGVLILPQRQTALVAKQAATLELLAPGRIRLGVGIGWNDVEYEALGADFAVRAARLDEQILLLRRLWTEPTVDHAGISDVVRRAGIVPLPPRPLPIWVGSGPDPRAVARVGRLADGWLPVPQLQPGFGFEDAWRAVRDAAAGAGRDPGAIGLEGHVRARAEDLDRVRARVERWRDAGAGAVAVNTLRSGARWPAGHLDVLLQAADLLRD